MTFRVLLLVLALGVAVEEFAESAAESDKDCSLSLLQNNMQRSGPRGLHSLDVGDVADQAQTEQVQESAEADHAQTEQVQENAEADHAQTEKVQENAEADYAQVEQVQENAEADHAQTEQVQKNAEADHAQTEQVQEKAETPLAQKVMKAHSSLLKSAFLKDVAHAILNRQSENRTLAREAARRRAQGS